MQQVEIKSIHNDTSYILRGLLEKANNSKGLVIMLHGFTGHMNENGYLFKQIASSLKSHGYASLRFDFMGSGISDGEFKEMTFETEVNDAKAIIDYAKSLKIGSELILLGFSMGGAVATRVANKYQKDLTKLILLSPAGNMDKIANRYFNNPTVKHYDEENIDMGGYLMNIAFLKSFEKYDLYEGCEKFTKPVLLIHGEKDLSVPLEYGKKYHELYSNSVMHIVPLSEHCYQSVNRRAFVIEHIIQFLGGEY